jgi:acyl-CoA synthetase (AMP-forming)/AMP-acid ligase II
VTLTLTEDQRSLLARFVADPEAVLASGNVAARLFRTAVQYPLRTAIFEPHDAWDGRSYRAESFAALLHATQQFARGLSARGITRGTRTVLMVPPSRDLVRLVYALLQLGAIPVLVDPGMGLKHLATCLAEAEPEAFIGVNKAHLARLLMGWAKSTLRIFITAGERSWLGAGPSTASFADGEDDVRAPFVLPHPEDPAAILFTSGSTGVPKGAVYTHGVFCSQVDQLQHMFGIQPGEIDLCTFPLFALFAPALGMTSVVPKMDFTRPARVDPDEILDPIDLFHVTNLFGSPALLNRVGRAAELQQTQQPVRVRHTASLQRVISAGAPVSPAILGRFARLLGPGRQIFTPYGATEALPVAVIGSDEVFRDTQHQTARGAGTCVGRPVPDILVRIIRISDEPIAHWSDDLLAPAGQIGEIVVHGPVVTQEYFRRPDLTALAKIPDFARDRAWHRMGDVGYFDEQGRLWFCGRKSQRVITPERTYFTDPVEGVFNAHPAVFRSALVGVSHSGVMAPVLCVELEKTPKPRSEAAITAELLQLGAQHEHTRAISTVLYHPSFPVDIRHNSKIFREQLAVWAQQQLRKRR